MPHLDEDLVQQLAQRLVAREAELVALLHAASRTAAESGDQPHEVQDFKDIAGHDAQAALEITAVWHAAQELTEVSAARRRLDNGSYGLCQTCGEPIGAARLLALPAAAFCTDCQALHERERPAPGHH